LKFNSEKQNSQHVYYLAVFDFIDLSLMYHFYSYSHMSVNNAFMGFVPQMPYL